MKQMKFQKSANVPKTKSTSRDIKRSKKLYTYFTYPTDMTINVTAYDNSAVIK